MAEIKAIEIVFGIVMIVVSVILCILIVLQESPKGNGLDAITGSDSFLNQNQGRVKGAMLAKSTRVVAIVFFVVSTVVYAVLARI